ncbi:ubiquitin carboxyl-terminal hydrolase 5-like isoform X2 [Salvia hispanica]|uniref:ubiquitin carboxyl-terminal hydrolase 5-like isoform X2 n=1 Tax=Salvia hispanica TaxID=49212 RepID=UPI0020091B08|nr:ubiquitin carboxyl-terminal hydrolase 5-like isoform X2 [Salvia hispanica]
MIEANGIYAGFTIRWWQNWLEYVNQTSIVNDESSSEHQGAVNLSALKKPSCIDNSDLIDEAVSEDSAMGIELHDTLVEGTDYILLPKEVWNKMHSWYGGGPVLARKVINTGLSQTELSVEVYPLRLELHLMPKGDRSAIRMSKKETIGELHRKACEIFDLTPKQVSIWDYFSHQKHALMNDMEKTLDDANIQMDQDILVEVINIKLEGGLSSNQENGSMNNGSLAAATSHSSIATSGGLSASKYSSRNGNSGSHFQNLNTEKAYGTSGVSTRGAICGLTGLLNLGNTCFMNSAIQCLVHTPEFAWYFREDYHQEINRQNPLGMVGELALAFGDLLRKLWAPGRAPVAPRLFKSKLARFAPQFSGCSQHDSQELLAFLLDGLHEDLNRVKHKPYIKSRDADGRADEEVADEYWANHIARNDSIIVDVCQGQYKSTLVCPVCNKVSVTFDPFMYLSLPLQFTATRSMTLTIFTCDGSALPAAYTLTVPKHGRCRDLVQALSNACSLQFNEKLLLAEIRGHLIYRFLEDPMILLSTIKEDNHLTACKIPKVLKKTKFLQLIHRREEQGIGNAQSPVGWKPYGTPLVSPISCDDTITRSDIQQIVHTMLSPMLRTKGSGAMTTSNASVVASNESHADSSIADPTKGDGGSSKPMLSEKLPLQLVDENNACIDLTVGDDKVVKLSLSSMSILVFVDWSQKLLASYDTKHIENLPEVCKHVHVSKKARNEPLSLYTCLEAFLREEPLVPEDMWYCPQCKERRQASKKLDLWRLPEVLVIHLKRFSYSRSMKHKLDTFVNFPIHDFDLTNYVANENNTRRQIYELYALTNHYGSMGSGHYTAHIKLLDENRWYNFDDSHISPINEEDVKSAAAYVLFYKRVTLLSDEESADRILILLKTTTEGLSQLYFAVGDHVWSSQGFILRFVQAAPNVWNFVLSAPSTNAYVAIGFSPNGNMVGSTAVVGWVESGGTSNMKQYFLGGQQPSLVTLIQTPTQGLPFGNASTMLVQSGRIYIAFQLLTAQPGSRLIYAVGPVGRLPQAPDFRLTEHQDKIATSLNYASGQFQTEKRPESNLRRIHGLLNMLGWGILIPIGVMVARYMRKWDPLWFYMHAVTQSIGFILGLIGVMCGFVLDGRLSADVPIHKALGIVIISFGCLQVLALLIRPDKSSKVRKYWNWYHFGVGRALVFLAVINVFYGIHLGKAGSSWNVGFAAFLVVLFVITLIMEIRIWCRE